jgi:hypothetical protein
MYKYIIYCSVSAVIIIISKYLYQNWIKQNHSIATLKQEVSILNDKIKRLETELEKNKNSISGGIKIPIQFAQIQKKTPIEFQQNKEKTITLENDIQSASSSETKSKVSSNDSSSETKSKVSSKDSVKKLSPPKKILEVENLSEINETELDNITLSDLNVEEQVQTIQEIVIEPTVETKKTIKKKAGIPDAKNYNNGDKVWDENGGEYLCVVGKRGGHSWKRLN